MRLNSRVASWVVVGAVVGLLGCASTPRTTILTMASPGVDLAEFRTFGFMQPLSTDRPNGVRTNLSQQLMTAMSNEMALRYVELSDQPQLLINFFVNTEDRMQVTSVPTASTFHSYRRGRYRAWGSYRTHVREYTRGTLAIDVVDAETNTLVFEGVAQGRMRQDIRQMDQAQVDAVVRDVMAEFTPISD